MRRIQQLSMELIIPDSLPSPEAKLYQDSQLTITLVNEKSRSREVCINIYLENHDSFDAIVPGDTTNCSRYDGTNGNPSRVSELPPEMCKIIMSAVDQVMDKHDLTLANPQNGYGVCHTCMGEQDECGMLGFSVYLKKT